MLSEEIKHYLYETITGKVLFDEPMKKHTSFQIGGPADSLIIPKDRNDLSKILILANEKDIPVFVIGNGTKLLVSDEGIRGIVVKLSKCFENVIISGTKIEVESGYPLAKLSRLAANQGLSGLEFAVDIPGTVGGGITMNAGAFGSTISSVTTQVTSMDAEGQVKINHRDDLQFGPRKSIFQENNEMVLSAEINLRKDKEDVIKEKMQSYTEKRKNSQPYEKPNAGCIFKNPSIAPAGKLIDMAGLKGMILGGAKVSEKHANFIVNHGNAKAQDVYQLIKLVQEKIHEEHDVLLELELKIIGHFT